MKVKTLVNLSNFCFITHIDILLSFFFSKGILRFGEELFELNKG